MNSVIRFTEINEAVYGYIFHLKLVLEFFMINFGIQQSMGQATTKKGVLSIPTPNTSDSQNVITPVLINKL